MFKKIKQNKGITMMVLVVTIIVMLILAGVSVAVFNPNTGLVTKSKKIVNGYEASQEIQATETDTVIESLKDRKKRSTNITWAKSTSDWTNENVTVTAKANLSGYTLEISKDGKNWSKNTTIEVSQYGEEVFARLMNNSNNEDVQYSNVQITNIDKQAPTNNAPTAKVVTTNKIEVENNQVESGSGKNEEYSASGIKEVKYRLLSSRDAVESLEGYDWQDEGVFEKLTHNTTYYAQTYMKDNAGNETYSLVQEIKTVIVPSAKDFITQTPNTDKFTNKDKQILVSSINKDFNFEVSTDNKIWTTAVDGTITKTTTKNGDKVYARLTDGYNYGEAVVYTESLIDKDLPTTAAPTLKATTNAIKVSNNQKDATSKITTQYQIKKATEITWKDLQDSDTFSNLEQTTKYDVRTHSVDEAGNESYSSSATIETSTVPSGTTTGIIEITATPSTWTNQDVTVKATTKQTGFTIQISTDGNTFKDGDTVKLTENGTVYARLRDSSNNYGGIASKAITIIDKVAPSAPTITNSSNGNWSNKDVTITLKATDNLSGIQRYEWFENGAWTTRTLSTTNETGTIIYTAERNETLKFRTVDNANNISNEAATTVRIDKTLPTNNAPTATSTTDTVTVTNKQTDAASGIAKVQYQIKENSSSTWGVLQDSNKFTGLKQNTKYDVRTHARDNAGNEQDSVVTSVTTGGVPSGAVTGIITLTAEPSNWTNGDVKVTATTTTTGYIMQMSTDGGKSFIDATSVTMTENGTVVARLRDASRNYGGIASKNITIIDKNGPTGNNAEIKNVTSSGYDVYVYNVTDNGGSGVDRVQFPTWTELNGGDDIQSTWATNTKAKGTLQADGTTWVYHVNIADHNNENGKYNSHIYAYDKLGNSKQLAALSTTVPAVAITWNANGGTSVEGWNKQAGTQLGTLPTTSKIGSTFQGWYETKESLDVGTWSTLGGHSTAFAQQSFKINGVEQISKSYHNSISITDENEIYEVEYIGKYNPQSDYDNNFYIQPNRGMGQISAFIWGIKVENLKNENINIFNDNYIENAGLTVMEKVGEQYLISKSEAYSGLKIKSNLFNSNETYKISFIVKKVNPNALTPNDIVRTNATYYARWKTNQYSVTCKDYFVDDSNNLKVKLGTQAAKSYDYGTSVSGSAWGTTSPYSSYAYSGASTITLGAGNTTVYRYFKLWTNINVLNPSGTEDAGASGTFNVSYNSGASYENASNEKAVYLGYGTKIIIKDITPAKEYFELDSVTGATYDSTNKYYVFNVVTPGSINIKMKYKNYSISYNLNGGTISSNPTSYAYNNAAITLNNPTRTGYTFTGWTGSNGTTAQTSVTIPTNSYGNKSYTANWLINQYNVTYDNNFYSDNIWPDSNSLAKYSNWRVTETSIVSDSTSPVGYRIDNKMDTGENGGQYYAPAAALTSGKQYTWSIYLKASSNISITLGDEQGGTKNVNLTTSWQRFTHTFTANDSTYKAFIMYKTSQWANETVSFADLQIHEGGANTSSAKVNYSAQIGTLPTPSRAGYTFKGWFTDPVGGTQISTTTTMGASNITYYAHWAINQYTAAFNGNGGSNGTNIIKPYGANLGALPSSSRTGYTFKGWFTATSGGTQINTNTLLNGNVTYYAQWTTNKYSVTCEDYFVDDSNNLKVKLGTQAAKSYDYGTSVSGSAWGTTSPYSSYAYSGASTITLGAGNTTVYRYFKLWTNINVLNPSGTEDAGASGTFNVSYNSGSSYENASNEKAVYLGYGTKIIIKDITPAKEYFELDSVTGATYDSTNKYYVFNVVTPGSINIKMKYKNYSISYNLNGGTISSNPTSYAYNSAAITLNNPTRTGYTFTGWTGSNGTTAQTSVTIPTNSYGNKSYTANWSVNSYTVKRNAYKRVNDSWAQFDTKSESLAYGTSYDVTTRMPTAPTGYHYNNSNGTMNWSTDGYKTASDTNPFTVTSNTEVHVHTYPNTYTIAFNGNGATSGSTASMSASYDIASNLTANGFAKTGYTFQGWATSATGGAVYANSASVSNLTATNGATVTLYAVWKDVTAPTNTAPTVNSYTSDSITVINKQTDNGSGINTIQYQIKKTSDTTWDALQTSATLATLNQNTSYDIRTYAVDKSGNASYSNVITIKTKTIPTPTLTQSRTGYSSSSITVTATTTESNYTMQMSVGSTNNFSDKSSVTLSEENYVYARLRDNSGNYSEVAKIDVEGILSSKYNKIYMCRQVDYHPTNDPYGRYQFLYYDQEGEFGTPKTVYLTRSYAEIRNGSADSGEQYCMPKKSTNSVAFNRMLQLNPKYKQFVGNTSLSALNDNARYATYLCDTSNFTKYYDSSKANFVVGGPSYELITKVASCTTRKNVESNPVENYEGVIGYDEPGINDQMPRNDILLNILIFSPLHLYCGYQCIPSPSSRDESELIILQPEEYRITSRDAEDYDDDRGYLIRPVVALKENVIINFEEEE